MRLSPLYVSVHVTDTEMRRKYLRNPTAPDILEQLRWLADRHITVHTQLVVVPGFNDGVGWNAPSASWPSCGRTVQSVSVVPVGLTRHHKYGMRAHTRREAAATLDYVESLQPIPAALSACASSTPPTNGIWSPAATVPPLSAYDGQELHENGLGMVRQFLDDWEGVKKEIVNSERSMVNGQRVMLVTATLFAPVLQETAVQFAALTAVHVEVLPVVNQRLGETITVAGLLMGAGCAGGAGGANGRFRPRPHRPAPRYVRPPRPHRPG
jgi:NifB/MoaA-like Fe-S oxidoreductase